MGRIHLKQPNYETVDGDYVDLIDAQDFAEGAPSDWPEDLYPRVGWDSEDERPLPETEYILVVSKETY